MAKEIPTITLPSDFDAWVVPGEFGVRQNGSHYSPPAIYVPPRTRSLEMSSNWAKRLSTNVNEAWFEAAPDQYDCWDFTLMGQTAHPRYRNTVMAFASWENAKGKRALMEFIEWHGGCCDGATIVKNYPYKGNGVMVVFMPVDDLGLGWQLQFRRGEDPTGQEFLSMPPAVSNPYAKPTFYIGNAATLHLGYVNCTETLKGPYIPHEGIRALARTTTSYRGKRAKYRYAEVVPGGNS